MDADGLTALRQWMAGRECDTLPPLGDAQLTRTPQGVVIAHADPRIGVTLEVVEDSADGFLTFALETDGHGEPIGVLTIPAVNCTLHYSVIAYCVPYAMLVCDRIVDP